MGTDANDWVKLMKAPSNSGKLIHLDDMHTYIENSYHNYYDLKVLSELVEKTVSLLIKDNGFDTHECFCMYAEEIICIYNELVHYYTGGTKSVDRTLKTNIVGITVMDNSVRDDVLYTILSIKLRTMQIYDRRKSVPDNISITPDVSAIPLYKRLEYLIFCVDKGVSYDKSKAEIQSLC